MWPRGGLLIPSTIFLRCRSVLDLVDTITTPLFRGQWHYHQLHHSLHRHRHPKAMDIHYTVYWKDKLFTWLFPITDRPPTHILTCVIITSVMTNRVFLLLSFSLTLSQLLEEPDIIFLTISIELSYSYDMGRNTFDTNSYNKTIFNIHTKDGYPAFFETHYWFSGEQIDFKTKSPSFRRIVQHQYPISS